MVDPRPPRRSDLAGPEPALPDAVAANELSRDVRAELRALSKASADIVARRLVASGELLNVDPELALRHAMAARKIASRIPAVREAVGLAAYRCGQWQLAMSELRAFQRITGHNTHLAVLADCERGLGRPERAVDLFRHTDRKSVGLAEWIELLIVAAGARRDMGQIAASVTMLQIPQLEVNGTEEWRARLRYAYADALEAAGRIEEAYRWFARAIELDPQGLTDAVDRLLALEGVAIDGDELPDDEDDELTAGAVTTEPADANVVEEADEAAAEAPTAAGAAIDGRDSAAGHAAAKRADLGMDDTDPNAGAVGADAPEPDAGAADVATDSSEVGLGRPAPPAQFSDLASATDTPISPPPAEHTDGDEAPGQDSNPGSAASGAPADGVDRARETE